MGRTITTSAREFPVFLLFVVVVVVAAVAVVDMTGAGRTCFHFHYYLLCFLGGRLCSRILLGLTVNCCRGNSQLHCWASAFKVEMETMLITF